LADADGERQSRSVGAGSIDAATLARDAKLLKATVREAGSLALSLFGTELKTWIKGTSSPVSEADIAVNDLLETRLRSATSDYGWLSEESADGADRLSRRRVWIVDPIDGTRSYLAGKPDWCVSVALVEDAAPVIAAVFAAASDEFFFALRGEGATLNGIAVSATGGTEIDFARMAGPKALVERRHRDPPAHRIAGTSPVPRRGRPARCGLCRWPEPRLGSCGGEFDRAGSEW
jgi:myo-inositol-1(or 4)-monophosphatase